MKTGELEAYVCLWKTKVPNQAVCCAMCRVEST
jgi:hypothetical protein